VSNWIELTLYTPLPSKLESCLRESPILSPLFDSWPELALPNCWLVAGAVVQTYWNSAHGFAPLHGINDIDVIYFDPDDLSEETEKEHSVRINKRYEQLFVKLDVKNEARVHLWYENRFGFPINAYSSVESAMKTFPTTAGAIGVRSVGHKLQAYSPFGFDDLMNLVVRPNRRQITRAIYAEKVARWRPNWPRVRFLDWDDA
jgi:hypothetical protein